MFRSSRVPVFRLIVAAVLAIVLLRTPAPNTLADLARANLSTALHPELVLGDLFRPNSGQEVLPVQVRQALSLLQMHQVTSYRLSKQLDSNPLLRQRTIESAWPIQISPTSAYRLALLGETGSDVGCVVVDQREDIALEYCL